MNELSRKMAQIISEKKIVSSTTINKELDYMEEHNLLEDTFRMYEKIEKDPAQRGNKNKVNSSVAYGLGITSKSPSGTMAVSKRRTYGRDGFPDIDMDFDYKRRHEIIEHINNKYGRDRVGNIGTVLTLKTKAALRRVIKALDPDNNTVYDKKGNKVKSDSSTSFKLENAILGTLPGLMKRPDGTFINSVEDAYAYGPYGEFRKYMDMYPEVRRVAGKMEGRISAFGCLAKDTPIFTDKGWVRIDQLDKSCKVAYVDQGGEIQYSSRYVPHMTGRKKVYEMKLDNGDFIKVTDEHLIFTDQGCVEFEKIRENPEKYKVLSVKDQIT